MQIDCCAMPHDAFEADALIIGAPALSGKDNLPWKLPELEKQLSRWFDADFLTSLNWEVEASKERFSGHLGETLVLPTYRKHPVRFLILTGLGCQKTLSHAHIQRASAAAIRACQHLDIAHLSSHLLGEGLPTGKHQGTPMRVNPQTLITAMVEGAILGNYKFTTRRTQVGQSGAKGKPAESSVKRLTVMLAEPHHVTDFEQCVEWGTCVATQTNLARDWVNDSANYVTPTFLKNQAEQIKGLQCKVLSMAEVKAMGMNTFASVAQGSSEPGWLIHLSYEPKTPATKTVALVGKGITFDSGGLSLKPPASMELMKMDMAGAASVLATMKAIAEYGDCPVAVHGIIPACENMVNGHASKPGDVVTTLSGQTVEINNTDAEGRLILCDALTYVQNTVNPDEIIDLATLTGACITALGKVCAAAMGTSDSMIEALKKAGQLTGEKFWQLPLFEEYKESLKSDIADLKNAGSKGQAGSSSAGLFLKAFIEEETDWVHLDIAGPAYISHDDPETPKGGTGFGVRTLLYYLYQRAE
jgi:leucyl aminopeptidase